MSKLSKQVKTGIIVGATVVGGVIGNSTTPSPEALRELSRNIDSQISSVITQAKDGRMDRDVADRKLEELGRQRIRVDIGRHGPSSTQRTATGAAIGAGLGTLAVLGLNAMKGQSKGAEVQTSGAPNPGREDNAYDATKEF